jgi:hypothetical protein
MTELIESWTSKDAYNDDQNFLGAVIWPLMQHDQVLTQQPT